MPKSRSRRLAAGAGALAVGIVSLMALAPNAVAAPTTVHGSETYINPCSTTAVPVLLPDDGAYRVAVTVGSDASPQPHGLGPITLSNTTVEVRIAADVFQGGVDAGIVGDGFTMPTTVSVTLMGSNTTEATRTFSESMTTTLHVDAGVASPVVTTLQLADTVWHPADPGAAVSFREESARIMLTLDLPGIGIIVSKARCRPSTTGAFIALAGVPESTTSAPTTAPPTSTLVVDPPVFNETTAPGATALPRTGSPSGYAMFVGLSCIAGGALLLGGRRRNSIR